MKLRENHYTKLHFERAGLFKAIRATYSLRKGKFDLSLPLFAGRIAKSCAEYLKSSGFLLTNHHQGDAIDALNPGDFELIATVRFQKGTYSISEDRKGTKLTSGKLNTYPKHMNAALQHVEDDRKILIWIDPASWSTHNGYQSQPGAWMSCFRRDNASRTKWSLPRKGII